MVAGGAGWGGEVFLRKYFPFLFDIPSIIVKRGTAAKISKGSPFSQGCLSPVSSPRSLLGAIGTPSSFVWGPVYPCLKSLALHGIPAVLQHQLRDLKECHHCIPPGDPSASGCSEFAYERSSGRSHFINGRFISRHFNVLTTLVTRRSHNCTGSVHKFSDSKDHLYKNVQPYREDQGDNFTWGQKNGFLVSPMG